MPPEKNGDFAFLLHILGSMNATGSGAVILPHGVLFRGNKEAELREKILKRGYIKGIIGLPANLFYGTGIPASIIVLDKSEATENRPVFMVDASKGFIKDGNKKPSIPPACSTSTSRRSRFSSGASICRSWALFMGLSDWNA
jgi:type I restriction enzyme M protein